MDQESFRKLLHAPKAGSSGTAARRAIPASAHGKKTKTKSADPTQPAFKPRTVKKPDLYRDRAGERRQGLAHDYAQVEALAEDFEKRNADKDRETLEEQRKFLGGDSEHTVLVKGLDFALLEQNKARLAESTVDDDVLEQAFAEGSAQVPKKRTREDIVKELKNKRLKGEGAPPSAATAGSDEPIDDAKKSGKFKPIGFKPIGASVTKGKKKAREGEKDGVVKKKKKKAADGTPAEGESKPSVTAESTSAPIEPTLALAPPKRAPPSPESEPMDDDDDDDIFASAGDYAGIEVGDDDGDDASDAGGAAKEPKDASDGEIPDSAPPPRRWVDIDEPPVLPPKSPSPERMSEPPAKSASPEREEGEEEEPVRLQPLASSSVPSIRELLAMDEAKEREEKRRERREKKKGKKTKSGDDSE